MIQSLLYAWEFDRPAPRFFETYQSFSVGIFQWLPKASGKGLKKSKAMARVLGYTAEPDRVYEKADDLCGRLNRERAMAAAPPDWLQKQYAVPRPAGMVVERTREDFTAGQVRAVRLRVMKERLLPAGFVVGEDATYVRRQGDQIHLINFQGSRYGHKFTVNLGFHYAFVAPLFRGQPIRLMEFGLLDCIIRERIGFFLPEKRDSWFDYGDDRKALVANFELCATTCLDVFDRCVKRWSDPCAFLDDTAGKGKSEWSDRADDLALACVALKAGRLDEVETRLKNWNDSRSSKPPRLYERLATQLREHLALARKGVSDMPAIDWVVPDTVGQSRKRPAPPASN
jgi:hypothetical protein